MVYVTIVAVAFAATFAVAFSATIRLLRAQLRESQRREAELLNRIMFLMDRPWVEAPAQASTQPEADTPKGEIISWPEAVVDVGAEIG